MGLWHQAVFAICLLNEKDKDVDEQIFRQDVVLYDWINKKIFSDKLRIVVINIPQLKYQNLDIDAEYYEKCTIFNASNLSEYGYSRTT